MAELRVSQIRGAGRNQDFWWQSMVICNGKSFDDDLVGNMKSTESSIIYYVVEYQYFQNDTF